MLRGVLQGRWRAAQATVAADAGEFAQAQEEFGAFFVLGDDGEHAHRGVGRAQVLRREVLPVLAQRRHRRLRRDEVGVGVGDAEARRVGGAVEAGTEQPHFRRRGGRWRGLQCAERLGQRRLAGDERHEVLHLRRIVFDAERIAVGEGRGGQAVASRSAANAQIDAPRIEHFEQAEVLGHLVGRIVGEHHAAGTDPDAFGLRRQARDEDLRRRAGEGVGSVVLRHPVAVVAEFLAALRQRRAVRDCVRGALAAANGRLVEHAQANGQDELPLAAPRPCESTWYLGAAC